MPNDTKLELPRITREEPYKICFVCLGNICRSPTAEGVMQHLAIEEGLGDFIEIDSAGTSAYHIGESPNPNSQTIAHQHGVKLQSKARQFEPGDLDYFDLVLAMDRENLQNIRALNGSPELKDKIYLLRDFDPEPEDGEVPDPYYGGIRGFERVYEVIERSCQSLLDKIRPAVQK